MLFEKEIYPNASGGGHTQWRGLGLVLSIGTNIPFGDRDDELGTTYALRRHWKNEGTFWPHFSIWLYDREANKKAYGDEQLSRSRGSISIDWRFE